MLYFFFKYFFRYYLLKTITRHLQSKATFCQFFLIKYDLHEYCTYNTLNKQQIYRFYRTELRKRVNLTLTNNHLYVINLAHNLMDLRIKNFNFFK